jgi:C4-type Zn-finger protein
MVSREGYEDEDEFEDAIGGSWEEFLRAMPHIELRTNERGSLEFKVLQPDPTVQPRLLKLRVQTRQDLWRVLFKSPDASIRFPAMEFEIGTDHKRRIDSVYNYITSAEWNLSTHIRGRTDITSEHVAAIVETVDKLNQMLDCEEPFDIEVRDPAGACVFKPAEGVEVLALSEAGAEEASREGQAPASAAVATTADLTADEEADALARELAELRAEAE